jgi:hypothetical protein
MSGKKNSPSIDITLYLGSSLFTGKELQGFQNALVRLTPEWASKLHLWRFQEPRVEIDVTREGAIERVMLSKGTERGELFQRLEKLAPLPDPDRRLGSMELRGAYPGLTVVLRFDDWIFCPIGTSWTVGNTIAIQVRSSNIEQSDASDWTEKCMAICGTAMDLLFGFACSTEEYAAKNMSTEGGGLRAIGLDVAKHLPGLYWLTFLGAPYATLIGHETRSSAPADRVVVCKSGYLIRLSSGPKHWNSPEARDREAAVRKHLGQRYFFDRERCDRETASPFCLPKLTSPGKIESDVDVDGVLKQIRIKKSSLEN